MVCMVRNEADNQMIPSCATYPSEGMRIDTSSDEVKALRRMSLELLLSDHRADCEAPCTFVCPAKIDVARLILLYDRGLMAEAKAVLASKVDLSDLPCPTCKAGCEKACRRGRVDQPVSIRAIVKEVAESGVEPSGLTPAADDVQKRTAGFSSKLGVYSKAESEWLKEVYTQPSRCLHCACEGQAKCQLRELATKTGIKSPRYGVSTRLPVKVQQHITGRLYYEPAKCVRCGLCVYNSEDGFTFQYRGFNM